MKINIHNSEQLSADIADLFDVASGVEKGTEVATMIARHLEVPGYNVIQAGTAATEWRMSPEAFMTGFIGAINGRRNISDTSHEQAENGGLLVVPSDSFAYVRVEYPDVEQDVPDRVVFEDDYDESYGITFFGEPVRNVEHYGLYVSSGGTAIAWHWKPRYTGGWDTCATDGTLTIVGHPSDRFVESAGLEGFQAKAKQLAEAGELERFKSSVTVTERFYDWHKVGHGFGKTAYSYAGWVEVGFVDGPKRPSDSWCRGWGNSPDGEWEGRVLEVRWTYQCGTVYGMLDEWNYGSRSDMGTREAPRFKVGDRVIARKRENRGEFWTELVIEPAPVAEEKEEVAE